MKYLILTTLFFFFIKLGLTQNPNLDYKNAIKIYNQTSFEEFSKTLRTNDSSGNYLDYRSTNLQILHPTIAYQCKTKKNNFREFELTGFSFAKNVERTEFRNNSGSSNVLLAGTKRVTSYIAVRYEYIFNFNKNKDKKLVPSIGIGINPYFRSIKDTPKVSTVYRTSESDCGFKTFIDPRLTYYFSPKFFLDVNAPLTIQDFDFKTSIDDNPAIPVNQRKITTIDFNVFHNIANLRIGIGLKI